MLTSKEILKKFFVGIILGILIFLGFYFYFFYIENQSTFRNRIQEHQIYTIIFFMSIVVLYTLQGNNKIFKFLIFIIILINLFILGELLFRNNIGLNSQQFIILFLLLLIALGVSYIQHKIRFFLISIIGIGILFILLVSILPMYETIPSNKDFIQSQKTKIFNKGAKEGIITIKNTLTTKEIPVNMLQEKNLDINEKIQISFASKNLGDKEKIFIDLGNGGFINIYPQSAIVLQKSGEQTIMQIIQGNIEYYIPDEFSGTFKIIGKYKGNSKKEIQNTVREEMINDFENKRQQFFINQLGGDIILNSTVNKIIKLFITILYTINPTTYQNNKNNYEYIQEYLGLNQKTIFTSSITGEHIKNMINDIMSQIKKGSQETQIFQRLNK